MRYALSLLLFALLIGCAGPTRMSADQAAPVVTIEEHNLSQNVAFARLARWAAETFVNANEVVQLSDPEAGTLVLRGAHRVQHTQGSVLYPLGFTMTVDVREDRVRFTQTVGEPYSSPFMVPFVTNTAASEMQAFFPVIRASAMEALTAQDDF